MAAILDEGGTANLLDEAGGIIYDEAGPPPAAGSWWGLDTVFKQSREEFQAYVSRPPMACPRCGEPLTNAPATASGSGIELYCKYDFWKYPQDYIPPHRPGY